MNYLSRCSGAEALELAPIACLPTALLPRTGKQKIKN